MTAAVALAAAVARAFAGAAAAAVAVAGAFAGAAAVVSAVARAAALAGAVAARGGATGRLGLRMRRAALSFEGLPEKLRTLPVLICLQGSILGCARAVDLSGRCLRDTSLLGDGSARITLSW